MSTRKPTDQRRSEDTPADDAPEFLALAAEMLAVGQQRPTTNAASLPLWQSCRRPRPWWWRCLAAVCVVAAWSVTLALVLAAALRLFYHDGTNLLICLNAFTLYLYLPAYACLAWAAWQRRWPLAALSGLVVCCHLVWVGPDFVPISRAYQPSAASGSTSPDMRVLFANVLVTNTEYQPLLDEIAEADPDVVVLVECTRLWHSALNNSPILAPYVYGRERASVGRIAIYSRLPLVDVQNHYVTDRYNRIVTIRLGTDLMRLFCLHSPRPMEYPLHDYAGYWKKTLPSIVQQPGPLVVIGDFNATQHSRVYQQLTSGRLRSAHKDRGRGYAVTWPNGYYRLPPIRIDQALVSPQVQCLDIAEGRGRGSDHKPLILDVRISRDSPPAASARLPAVEDERAGSS